MDNNMSTKTYDRRGLLSSLSSSGNSIPFGMRAVRSDHHHFALSTSLRLAKSDSRSFSGSSRPPLDCMYHNTVPSSDDGKHGCEVSSRSEFGCGVVVKDTYCCGFNWCELVLAVNIFGWKNVNCEDLLHHQQQQQQQHQLRWTV